MPEPIGDAPGGRERALAWALLNLIQVRPGTTPDTLVQRLIAHCLDLLPADAVGVMLTDPQVMTDEASRVPDGTAVHVAASSHEELRRLEAYEIHTARGPCIEALRSVRPRHVADFTDSRVPWPGLALRATAVGYRAMWAEPLSQQKHVVGVINLYRRTPGTPRPRHRAYSRSLARAAATGLLLQRALSHYPPRTDLPRQALAARVLIEQAKGILARRLMLSPDAAFEVLRTHAHANGMSLHDLARAVVDDPAGTWPPPGR
ncbi:GAF and ANTAR domain-containing protein [Streptomyces sclerotialus]|uniref:GAF and ANTAR domain-containing protein n=1 Tax=Streptomyces sclerotialus TaxID=1957 RepID=UPI0006906F49